jgi:hypothetical protein
MEYLLLVGAAILFVTIVIVLVRSGVLPPAEQDINTSLNNLSHGVDSIMPK